MIDDLHKLALQLDESAPDLRAAKRMRAEKPAIEEALRTVGQYMLDVDGDVYVFTAKVQP